MRRLRPTRPSHHLFLLRGVESYLVPIKDSSPTPRNHDVHIFTTPDLVDWCYKPRVDIAPRSDHRPVSVELKKPEKTKKNTKIWRLNTSHLQDPNFNKQMEEIVAQEDRSEIHSISWDRTKTRIRKTGITFGIQASKDRNLLADTRIHRLKQLESEIPPTDSAENVAWLEEYLLLKEEVSSTMIHRLDGRRIRARARWTEMGERSNRYFYRCMRARAPLKTIESVLDQNGNQLTEPQQIQERMREYYASLFQAGETDETAQDTLLSFWKARITPETRDILEAPLTLQEVTDAINDAPLNKAPGPDGISYEFYKSHTNKVAPKLLALFNDCWSGGNVPEDFRESHIVMLPKKGDLSHLANWRPLSLSNCDMKLLTRVMTARMQKACAEVVDEQQTGFIKDRSIFNNLHTVNLTVLWSTASKTHTNTKELLCYSTNAKLTTGWIGDT